MVTQTSARIAFESTTDEIGFRTRGEGEERHEDRSDMTPSRQDEETVRSVRRAFAILRAFGPADRDLPLGEIARRAGHNKPTARRLLLTLIGERLISQQGRSRDYSLSLGVLELSAGATPADPLRRRAQPLLAELAAATGATAFLVVPYDGVALCVETTVGDWTAPAPVSVGARLPLNISAAPRVLLAFQPLRTRMELLTGPFPALTPETPTDPFQLAGMMDTIRKRGWDASQGHVRKGISGLGVPLRDGAGEVIAAVGLAGPDARMFDLDQPRHLELVLGKVRDWEQRLGHEPIWPVGRARRRAH
jgi:DNA-binding IclR family transcriptional regulator